MRRHILRFFLVATMLRPAPATSQIAPVADHHQHLFSPTIAAILASPSNPPQVITARDVAALLDSAGIKRAALLSVAYMYGSPSRTVDDEYAKVRAENDWTATGLSRRERAPDGDRGASPRVDLEEAAVRCRAGPRVPGATPTTRA